MLLNLLFSRATRSEHINAIKNLSLHSEPSPPSRETSGDQPISYNSQPIHTKRTKQHGIDVERLKFLLRSNKRYNTRTLYEDYNKGLVIQNLYSIYLPRMPFFGAVPFFFDRKDHGPKKK